jgi:homoserine O-acetyltransferase
MSIVACVFALALQAAASPPPEPAARWRLAEADFVARDVRFGSGERLGEVRLHYATLGAPHRDEAGEIDNAVMLLHGTGGSGRQFLQPQFADELFGLGQPLDIARYWIILPDNIGHGRSSKPSDGLRMRFPRYDYDDMVRLQHRLLREGLGVRRLRLLLGTSMGCMHAFVWGETFPDFARALMPLACEPVEIAGLNRMWRQLVIDAEIRARIERDLGARDANDVIYQFESSRNYDPWPELERIAAPVMWVNSADDFINPRNFSFPQQAIARMRHARFRLIAETPETRGHGTHTWAAHWKQDLRDLIARSGG